MCQDLAEYNPFEPLYLLREDGKLEPNDEPMEEYDWQEWLANE